MTVSMSIEGQTNVWKEEHKNQAWENGQRIPGFAAKLWRRDVNGNVIQYTEYNNEHSPYGWGIKSTGNQFAEDNIDFSQIQPVCLK